MAAEGGVALEAPSTETVQAPAMEAPSVPDVQSDSLVNDLQQKVEGLQQAETSANAQANPDVNLDAEANSPSNINNNPAENASTEGLKPEMEEKILTEQPPTPPIAETQVEKDLQSDPLYQKSLGEVTANAIAKGELLDGKKLQEAALAKYQQEKIEEPVKDKAEQSTVDKSLQDAEQRIGALLENNKENLESAMVTVSAADLAVLLKALAGAKEADPKKKENKLQLILKLLGILVLSGVMETVKTVAPPASQN